MPCFLHWPAGGLVGGRDVDGLTAHFDLLPTLIDLCGLKPSVPVKYDGINLTPMLAGTSKVAADRVLIAHHQELPDPEKYRFAAVLQGSRRLILRNDRAGSSQPKMELYDLGNDAGQRHDVGDKQPELVAAMRREYEDWWNELSPDFERPAEIVVGDVRQNPVELTCFEWHRSQHWGQFDVRRGFDGSGEWVLRVAEAGQYEITLRRWPPEVDLPITAAVENGRAIAADKARLRIGEYDGEQPVTPTTRAVTFTVSLPAGSTRLQTWFTAAAESRGAYYATVRRILI